MQSDIDAQLTNFFEEAPPREFATVMRGYDRHQVDEHIRQIEADARTHRDQAQAMMFLPLQPWSPVEQPPVPLQPFLPLQECLAGGFWSSAV